MILNFVVICFICMIVVFVVALILCTAYCSFGRANFCLFFSTAYFVVLIVKGWLCEFDQMK